MRSGWSRTALKTFPYSGRMRIGELAQQAGVNTKTVRYYESIGLMPEPDRTANGYRTYGDAHAQRLHFIRDAQAAGLSLAEVSEILDLKAQGEPTCAHTTALLERRVAEVAAHIERLNATKRELEGLLRRSSTLDAAECSDPSRCHVIALDIPVEWKV